MQPQLRQPLQYHLKLNTVLAYSLNSQLILLANPYIHVPFRSVLKPLQLCRFSRKQQVPLYSNNFVPFLLPRTFQKLIECVIRGGPPKTTVTPSDYFYLDYKTHSSTLVALPYLPDPLFACDPKLSFVIIRLLLNSSQSSFLHEKPY